MKVASSYPFKARWLGVGALVIVGLLAIAAIILNATDNARRELDLLARANADERIWRIVEIEAKVHRFQHSVLNMHEPLDGHLHHMRAEFQELKSALMVICEDPDFASIKAFNSAGSSLEEADRIIQLIEPIVMIDFTTDPLLGQQLLDLSFELATVSEALSLATLPAFTELAQDQRNRVANSLLELGVVIVILVIVLFCSVAILLFSLRSGAVRTREITSTRNRLNAMIGTSLDGILVVGRKGEILDFNGAAERIFGYTPDEAIGQTMSDLIVPEHLRAAHEAGMNRYLETREKRVVDQGLVQLEAVDKSGRVFPVELSISSAESEDGEIFVSYIRDISERVAAQAELVDARDKAVAGEQAKAKFLAVMSHEMRTPLNGLLGSLQLLRGTKLNTRQRGFAEVMDTSGQLLLEHVNNVLDISRADAGQVKAVEQQFDLDELLHELTTSLGGQAKARGNSFSVAKLGDLPTAYIGDRGRLAQVLVNLVGNAIKFTTNGEVALEIEAIEGSDDVEFRVRDTGIGIADEDQARIFDDFVMIDSSYQREVEGTGLGLGIVQRLVSIMGGEIGVESQVGIGSTFWVRMPLPVAPETKVEAQEPNGEIAGEPGELQVLLVEDNEINRMVAREMLTQFGCHTTEAVDGREGVDMASRSKFDLILCDISMPRMDGIEATSLIRASDGPNADTPIVALTAHALPEDLQRFRAAGMTDTIVKPLTFEEMQRVISQITTRNGVEQHEDANNALESLLGADRAREVMAQANGELREGLSKIQNICDAEGDREEIRHISHKLCGVAAVIGLARLHETLTELEQSSANAAYEDLSALTKRALKQIKQR